MKKTLDPSKLKPYSGYTVKSYTTRKGNRSYTKNYFYYQSQIPLNQNI